MDKTGLSLFKIGAGLREIESSIEMAGGEVTLNDEVVIEALTEALTTKADGVVEYIKSKEATLDTINQRIKEFTELKGREQKKLMQFNEYVVTCMDMMGVDKIEGNLAKVSIRKPVKVVNITSEKLLDSQYIKEKVISRIDKDKIKDELKLGKAVEGAELIDGKRKATFKI
jgi:hypothetical protein